MVGDEIGVAYQQHAALRKLCDSFERLRDCLKSVKLPCINSQKAV